MHRIEQIKKFNKYGNRKTTIDGIKFDSQKEAARYCELKILQKCGIIKELELQPKFEIIPSFMEGGKKIRATYYIADFRYYDLQQLKHIVEDVKGFKTAIYKLKYKMFRYRYKKENFDFVEI